MASEVARPRRGNGVGFVRVFAGTGTIRARLAPVHLRASDYGLNGEDAVDLAFAAEPKEETRCLDPMPLSG